MVSRSDRAVAPAASSRKRIVTGVAISSTELCAADIRLRGAPDLAWRRPLDAPPSDGTAWPSLAEALQSLAGALGTQGGTLAVSLLPPLTEVRRLELPPLKDLELQRLIARNASRYFVNARSTQIVGTAPAGRRLRGGPAPVVAASASARLVTMIRTAAEQAGWNIERIAPAESAWAAGALTLWPAIARQSGWALMAQSDRTDLLQFEAGHLVGVRRFRAGAADASIIADTVGPTAKVGLAGVPAVRRELSSGLAAAGVAVVLPSGEWAASAERGDLLAAHFAGREEGPVLRAEDAVVVERERARRAAWTVAAAAAALFVLTAGLELWGVHRQLDLVRAERERIRPQIASTLIGRSTVDATTRHLTALTAAEREMPRWSAVITTLSQAITDDAYLTAIRARKDSLIIDGLAERASRVFDALQQSRVVADVKAAAPVRREIQEDGAALDHFTIAARVVLSGASAPAAAAASSTKPGPGR